jgi:hypothetical protein
MNQPVCHLCGSLIYDTQPTVIIDDRHVHELCQRGPAPMIGPPTCR